MFERFCTSVRRTLSGDRDDVKRISSTTTSNERKTLERRRREDADSYRYERETLRRIGTDVERRIRAWGVEQTKEKDDHVTVDIVRYGFETHMFADRGAENVARDIDLIVMVHHDWPTVHENPVWCRDFLRMWNIPRAMVVPDRASAHYVLRKTTYWRDILRVLEADENAPVRILPTIVVSATDDPNDVATSIESMCDKTAARVFVTKENYSAGKEGVRFLHYDSRRQIAAHVMTAIRRVAATCWAAPDVYGDVAEFLVQTYEPRFQTEPEVRLYYLRGGEFAYAKEHVGTVTARTAPKTLTAKDVAVQMKQVAYLLSKLPSTLRDAHELIRFDFGPGARLNEIEIFPDLLGGPSSGAATFERRLAEGISRQAISLFKDK